MRRRPRRGTRRRARRGRSRTRRRAARARRGSSPAPRCLPPARRGRARARSGAHRLHASRVRPGASRTLDRRSEVRRSCGLRAGACGGHFESRTRGERPGLGSAHAAAGMREPDLACAARTILLLVADGAASPAAGAVGDRHSDGRSRTVRGGIARGRSSLPPAAGRCSKRFRPFPVATRYERPGLVRGRRGRSRSRSRS
jgi:hypothetical protein